MNRHSRYPAVSVTRPRVSRSTRLLVFLLAVSLLQYATLGEVNWLTDIFHRAEMIFRLLFP